MWRVEEEASGGGGGGYGRLLGAHNDGGRFAKSKIGIEI